MRFLEKVVLTLKEGYICDSCLGRATSAQLLSGMTNKERGKTIRNFVAFLIDSGEKIVVDYSNFYGIKFRNVEIKPKKPKKCKICKNFFLEKVDKLAKRVVKKLKGIEFNTFLVGSVVKSDLLKNEEKLWMKIGIEFCEPIKSEINREIGKRVEELTGKKFKRKEPDVTTIINLNTNKIRVEIRSLYVFGKYKKLVRGIPQTKWVCWYCKGKGCEYCKGRGKMYRTSIQEIIEKPFLKVAKAEKSIFHGAGREDVDVRCLDYRPFVLEIINPRKRRINLKQIQKKIKKSKKVEVKYLRFTGKSAINKIKCARIDKSYLALVEFKKPIDKKKLKELKKLKDMSILQKTPVRVLHRRKDKFRRRLVKNISYRLLGRKKLKLKIKGESGLYIKELITGDRARTQPNIADMLDNEVKKIELDVIKIHDKGLKI